MSNLKTQKDIELILENLDRLVKAKTIDSIELLQKEILKSIKRFGDSTPANKQEDESSSASTI